MTQSPAPGAAGQGALAAGLRALAREMEQNGKARDDPMREVFARLGDRWSLLILLLLRFGPVRHAELRKLVGALSAEGEISQRMLTLKLRALERDGFVSRQVSADTPPQVTYALAALGCDLLDHVEPLMQWVRRRGNDIRSARATFKARDRDAD